MALRKSLVNESNVPDVIRNIHSMKWLSNSAASERIKAQGNMGRKGRPKKIKNNQGKSTEQKVLEAELLDRTSTPRNAWQVNPNSAAALFPDSPSATNAEPEDPDLERVLKQSLEEFQRGHSDIAVPDHIVEETPTSVEETPTSDNDTYWSNTPKKNLPSPGKETETVKSDSKDNLGNGKTPSLTILPNQTKDSMTVAQNSILDDDLPRDVGSVDKFNRISGHYERCLFMGRGGRKKQEEFLAQKRETLAVRESNGSDPAIHCKENIWNIRASKRNSKSNETSSEKNDLRENRAPTVNTQTARETLNAQKLPPNSTGAIRKSIESKGVPQKKEEIVPVDISEESTEDFLSIQALDRIMKICQLTNDPSTVNKRPSENLSDKIPKELPINCAQFQSVSQSSSNQASESQFSPKDLGLSLATYDPSLYNLLAQRVKQEKRLSRKIENVIDGTTVPQSRGDNRIEASIKETQSEIEIIQLENEIGHSEKIIEHSEVSIEPMKIAIVQSKNGADHLERTIEQSDIGDERSNVGINQSEVGMEHTETKMEQSDIVIEHPKIRINQSEPGMEIRMDQSKIAVEYSNPRINQSETGIENSRLGRNESEIDNRKSEINTEINITQTKEIESIKEPSLDLGTSQSNAALEPKYHEVQQCYSLPEPDHNHNQMNPECQPFQPREQYDNQDFDSGNFYDNSRFRNQNFVQHPDMMPPLHPPPGIMLPGPMNGSVIRPGMVMCPKPPFPTGHANNYGNPGQYGHQMQYHHGHPDGHGHTYFPRGNNNHRYGNQNHYQNSNRFPHEKHPRNRNPEKPWSSRRTSHADSHTYDNSKNVSQSSQYSDNDSQRRENPGVRRPPRRSGGRHQYARQQQNRFRSESSNQGFNGTPNNIS